MRDLKTMLAYECKRNPILAALAANITDRSEAEIDTAAVMPWMRQALGQLRADRRVETLRTQIEPYVVDAFAADPLGEMREWCGGIQFLPVNRGHLEVSPGMLLWFCETGLWIDTIHTVFVEVARQGSASRGPISRSGYYEALRACRTRMAPSAGSIADSGPLSGVRIYRV